MMLVDANTELYLPVNLLKVSRALNKANVYNLLHGEVLLIE